MFDLMALAFQADATRVATFLMAHEGSNRSYPFAGVPDGHHDTTRVITYIGSTPNGVSYPELGFTDTHHSNTHHNHEPEKVRKVAAITAFNIAQFAYMVKRMQGIREGDGTLLDNCIMMWGSGLEDGNKHQRQNLPFIVAGRGGGSIDTGRFLTNVSGNQGDLLTTLLGCAGVPLDRPVGIATKQITEIRANG
jgi:hypothetical protein